MGGVVIRFIRDSTRKKGLNMQQTVSCTPQQPEVILHSSHSADVRIKSHSSTKKHLSNELHATHAQWDTPPPPTNRTEHLTSAFNDRLK